jgi:hypothetical protein
LSHLNQTLAGITGILFGLMQARWRQPTQECAASIFRFTPKTPLEAKRFLAKNGVAVRTEKNTNLRVVSEA